MKNFITTFIIVIFTIKLFASVNVYAPGLTAPADSAVKQPLNVLLNWTPVAGAFSYKIMIDTNSLFSNPTILTSTYTAKAADQLLINAQYYWKVQAIGSSATDTSSWSVVRTFFTVALVELVSPSDSAVNQTPKLTLKWKAMLGVKYYDIICDTTPLFNSPLLINKVVDLSVTPHIAQMQGTTLLYYYSKVAINDLIFNQQYYWTVRARHDFDTSEYTIPRMFTVLDTVIITSPPDSAIDRVPDVQLKWTAIDGAVKYEVEVDTTVNFNSLLYYNLFSLTNSINADTLNFSTLYFWRVRAISAVDTSAYSATFRFNTIEKPVLTTPANGATAVSNHPTLKWEAISGVTGFEIFVDVNASFTSPMIFTVDSSNSEILISNYALVLYQTYYWKVKAMTSRDTSEWSDVNSFTTGNTGINDLTSGIRTNVYPNPAVDFINIELYSNKASSVDLNILDVTGRVVYNEKVSINKGLNIKHINLSNLLQGIYIVSLKNEDINFNKKLILDN